MPGKMVTVARFSDPVEAALARNTLEEAGVQAMLNNEEGAMLGFQLGGGRVIELLVFDSDVDAAREALLYRHVSLDHAQERTAEFYPEGIAEMDVASLHRKGITTADVVEEEGPPPDPREESVNRAFKAALCGLLFFPIAYYALFLFFRIVSDERPLPSAWQIKVWGTFLFCLPGVLFGCLVVAVLTGLW